MCGFQADRLTPIKPGEPGWSGFAQRASETGPWMKHDLVQLAREINTFCARLNDGLTAVAVLLGLVVVTVGVFRAHTFVPQMAAMVQVDDNPASPMVER